MADPMAYESTDDRIYNLTVIHHYWYVGLK